MATIQKQKIKFEIIEGIEDFSSRAIGYLLADMREAIKERASFNVAISGGHTPKRFFELIGQEPAVSEIPWEKVQLFWVDERCDLHDPDSSNYKLAADTFLKTVPIPFANIHRILGQVSDCQIAAHEYESDIQEVFGLKDDQVPHFDLIILGMGQNGDTGSLFRNCFAPYDRQGLACVVYRMDDDMTRITLTRSVLCSARHLLILVAGQEKAEILRDVFTKPQDEVQYPIHMLWPILDKITWLIDGPAAKYLSPP